MGKSVGLSRLTYIDGWRMLSVLAVVASHITNYSALSIYLKGTPLLGDYGPLGVQVFFVISGFVICRILLFEYSQEHFISIRAFYIKRALRIFPPLLLFVGTVWTLGAMGFLPQSSQSILWGLSFRCNFDDCGGWFGGHLWTLAYEEQFYLIFPLTLFLLMPQRLYVLAVFFILMPFVEILLFYVKLTFIASFLFNFSFLLAGVTWAVYERHIDSFARTIPIAMFAAAFVMVAVLGSLSPTATATALKSLLLPISIVFMLRSSAEVSMANRLLNLPLAVAIGQASYSVYLWQQLATANYRSWGVAEYTAAIAGCFLLSILSFKFFEKPLMAVGRTLSLQIIQKRRALERTL